ncbi:MAG TPA: polysaccharide biosynthesis/export family protein, partial [Terriglobales bacterium]|nr:polysaccharide biosynthesis/export family protein [Terriglobales bacterium]
MFKTVVFAFCCAIVPGVLFAQGDKSVLLDRPAGVQITNMSSDDPRVSSIPQERSRAQKEAPASESGSQETEPDIEFQDFVASSLGYRLPIFGHDLFRNAPSTFAPLDRVPVTPDYLIGPADELLIRAWGQIDINYRAVVDRSGNIYIPKIGSVSVAGLRYDQLQGTLREAVGRVFRNFDLSVTMGQLRSIQVFVVGQVLRPGVYTVSSLSTLVNALFASGGPL